MSFLINDALADGAAAATQHQASGTSTLIFLIATFVLFYFVMIRPQSKRAKEHRKMVSTLTQGDEVVTNGGILGRISKLDESFVTLEIAQGIEMKVQRPAIANAVPKGTIDSQ